MIIKSDASTDLTANALEKTIDAQSKDLMFKVLQSNQYRYPVKSAIRETASNGVDAHNEREIAKAILNGAAISDYYEVPEDSNGMAHSSAFNKNYYALEWLSDKKYVEITLIDRPTESRDLIRFEDWGIGLGGSRMEGFFSLAYSTKRLSKKLIGGFGLGAKAFLGTDIDSFRVTSYYNGKKFMFDVYETTVTSVTPKFSGGNKNDIYEFPKSKFQCYYEKTDRKNGVVIEATVIKSQKHDYERAVKQQLLYMTGVKFFTERSWGRDEIDFHADVLYSDDNIMISSNSVYGKPHILMGNKSLGTLVSYGHVDFEALEMSSYYGSVGIIVSPDEVEVSTSRENLLWKKRTREGIQAKFDKVKQTAEDYVMDKIDVAGDNLFAWLEASSTVIASTNSWNASTGDKVLSNLAKVIDIKSISFKKSGENVENFVYLPINEYFSSKENALISRYITEGKVTYKGYNDHSGQAERVGITNWATLFDSEIYLVKEEENVKKEVIRYLKKQNKRVCFIYEKGINLNKHLKEFIEAGISIDRIKFYGDIVVPEEELNAMEQLEEAVEMTLQQKRKLEGKILVKKVYNSSYTDNVEFTREGLRDVVGVYAPSSERDNLLPLHSFFDRDSLYLMSGDAIKAAEEEGASLVYYKDALFSIDAGAITFHSREIKRYLRGHITINSSLGAEMDLTKAQQRRVKSEGMTKISAYIEARSHAISLRNELHHNNNSRYTSMPYSQGSYTNAFMSYCKDLMAKRLDDSRTIHITDPVLSKQVAGVKTLGGFEDKIAMYKKALRMYAVINKNNAIVQAFNNGIIKLEGLNESLDLTGINK